MIRIGRPVDPNGPDSYSNSIAEKLIAYDNIYDLAAFVSDSSITAGKGDVLLYYPDNGADITANPDYLTRLDEALEKGAVLAFVDISAEEIDRFTDNLKLDLPSYLPDDATDEEKAELEDFYAFTKRLDSEDETVENTYTYSGTELLSGDKVLVMHVYSGDMEISFDASQYTEYVPEPGEVMSFDQSLEYDYVQDCVDDFLDWVSGMNTMKAVSEASPVSDGAVMSSAAETSAVFAGVTMTFRPLLHDEPRTCYFMKKGTRYGLFNKAWHRDTSMTFSILPLHRFDDGSDFYVITVTGNSDPSRQYAHISETSAGKIEGLGTDSKPGALHNDNILGYNYILQYTVEFKSGKNNVGSVYTSAPDTLNSSKKVTKGFTFELDGSITGGLEKDGIKGEVAIKPSWKWTSKEEYTVNDYERVNISGGQRVGWKWEFQRPTNGPQGYVGVWLKDVAPAGRTSVNLKGEFVIRVSKEEWKKYPSLKLVMEFNPAREQLREAVLSWA